ncbi:hypothetical protein HGRIS_011453 [Hohenbuehelia grisea]|uniref:Chitinase n=1 Tax=Hohenbuehelia grisea TaxID=104357 RepID=A0ABR3JV53_9AGAR
MVSVVEAQVVGHTTSSIPRVHVVYLVEVTTNDHKQYTIQRRFSEFTNLHDSLDDPYPLPPKRQLHSALVPLAWIDDALLSERKDGLNQYLDNLISDPNFRRNPLVSDFFAPGDLASTGEAKPAIMMADTTHADSTREVTDVLAKAADPSKPLAAAYYPSWSFHNNLPTKLDYSKFDILFFAFVVTNSSCTISWDSGSQSALKALVAAAKGKNTKIVLSVGGWTGSYWFSKSVSSAANRAKFVSALAKAVKDYNLDGVDIDWEYPNSEGAGNPYSSSDSANLLATLKAIRSALGASKIISAAVAHHPWLGANGRPLSNVSDFAAQMTYVNIMNYDVSGGLAPPGPNAPLGNSSSTALTAEGALAQWTAAGFPASKILLGLPLYGYVIKSSATSIQRDVYKTAKVDGSSGAQTLSKAANVAGDLSGYMGSQVAFNQLLAAGALKKQDGKYVGTSGYKRGWDTRSSTPFLYNTSKTTFVSYDDPQSLGLKAAFAKKSKMAGCFTWSMDQDDGTTLQDSIRLGLGI